MRDSRTLFCSSKLLWPPDRISLKFMGTLDTRAEKLWPVLLQIVVVVTGILYINARNMHFSQIMWLWVSYDDQNKQYDSDEYRNLLGCDTLSIVKQLPMFWSRKLLGSVSNCLPINTTTFPGGLQLEYSSSHFENPTSPTVNDLVFVMKTYFVFREW